MGFPGGAGAKNLAVNAGDVREAGSQESRRPPGEGHGNPLQCSSWRIPWTEEPGTLQSIGSQRVRHNWSDLGHRHRKIYSKPISKWSLRLQKFEGSKLKHAFIMILTRHSRKRQSGRPAQHSHWPSEWNWKRNWPSKDVRRAMAWETWGNGWKEKELPCVDSIRILQSPEPENLQSSFTLSLVSLS